MVNHPKANALNNRAISAAAALRQWGRKLREQYKAQSPEPNPAASKYLDDPRPEAVSLKGNDVDALIATLTHHARELEQFTWPSKS